MYFPNLFANADGIGLGVQGWLIIAENEGCTQLLERLYNEGVTPLGSQALERLRILRGRPRAGLELTESCTVLEVIYLTIAIQLLSRLYMIHDACVSRIPSTNRQICGTRLTKTRQVRVSNARFFFTIRFQSGYIILSSFAEKLS